VGRGWTAVVLQRAENGILAGDVTVATETGDARVSIRLWPPVKCPTQSPTALLLATMVFCSISEPLLTHL